MQNKAHRIEGKTSAQYFLCHGTTRTDDRENNYQGIACNGELFPPRTLDTLLQRELRDKEQSHEDSERTARLEEQATQQQEPIPPGRLGRNLQASSRGNINQVPHKTLDILLEILEKQPIGIIKNGLESSIKFLKFRGVESRTL